MITETCFGLAAVIAAVALLFMGAAQLLRALGIKAPTKEPELTEEQRQLIESEIEMNKRYTEGVSSIFGLGNTAGNTFGFKNAAERF